MTNNTSKGKGIIFKLLSPKSGIMLMVTKTWYHTSCIRFII